MSTPRRRLGTGPRNTTTTDSADPSPRLLPVERLVGDERQEHVDPRARVGEEPVPGRRPLRFREQ